MNIGMKTERMQQQGQQVVQQVAGQPPTQPQCQPQYQQRMQPPTTTTTITRRRRGGGSERNLIGATISINKGRYRGMTGIVRERLFIRQYQLDTIPTPLLLDQLYIIKYPITYTPSSRNIDHAVDVDDDDDDDVQYK